MNRVIIAATLFLIGLFGARSVGAQQGKLTQDRTADRSRRAFSDLELNLSPTSAVHASLQDRHQVDAVSEVASFSLAADPITVNDANADSAEDTHQAESNSSASNDGNHDLALKLQNPVASLISVPFQFNWDSGLGADKDGDRLIVNIQPVIPFSLGQDWNLISRTILPVAYEDSERTGVSRDFGMGDVLQSLFFSPAEPIDGWILGFGPVLQIPTGTNDFFRTKQFSLGPTGVALRQEHGWTYGILANHLWHLCGSGDVPDVNQTFLQPFLVYTFPTNTSLAVNTESTYDWNGEQWTVPINGSISQLVHFGKLPVQFQFGGRYYLEAPDGGPDWGLRFSITFLFPK